jgi:hypothetical protein
MIDTMPIPIDQAAAPPNWDMRVPPAPTAATGMYGGGTWPV